MKGKWIFTALILACMSIYGEKVKFLLECTLNMKISAKNYSSPILEMYISAMTTKAD